MLENITKRTKLTVLAVGLKSLPYCPFKMLQLRFTKSFNFAAELHIGIGKVQIKCFEINLRLVLSSRHH